MLCILYLLLSFSCLVHIVNCQTQAIYVGIQAPSQVNYHRDKLPFACTPGSNVGGTDSISDIILQKNYTTGWLDVVKVYLDSSTGQLQNKVTWTDTNMQPRASVNMSVVSPTTGAGLRIEISAGNVACNDEGNYRCAIAGNRASGGKLDSQSTHTRVGLIVQANSIESIQVNPRMPENIYNPGTAVTLTCTGDVGNPAGDLRWCIRREGIDISFTGYPNSADISQGSAYLSGCQYRRSSTLTYNVSSTIPEVDFRCETGPLATCGLSSTLAANFTLIRYTVSTNAGAQSSSETADAGVIAGAVIGSFVGVVIIVIIIYFVAFRKKSSGETYRTKEENGTGAAPIDNSVYSLPHKDRNQPRDRQKHYENKGMDEPHTRRYPDMDPRGHSNPAMDRSYDDRDGKMIGSKGPVMGSNASFGSAV